MPISDSDVFAGDESMFEDIPALRELERTLLEQERCTAPQAPWRTDFFEAVLLKRTGNDDRSAMLQKRFDAVKAMKTRKEYLMVMQAREQDSEEARDAPLTPTTTDRSMSKRTWETKLHIWRRDLRAWRRNHPQFALEAVDYRPTCGAVGSRDGEALDDECKGIRSA